MTALGTDLMTELRRPFRLRGPMGRRAMGVVALFTAVLVAVLWALGVAFAVPPQADSWLLVPLENSMTSSADRLRTPVLLAMAQVGTIWLWLCLIAAIPLMFAMVRRAHSTGLPLFLAIVLVILAVVSAVAIVLAVEERIYFPLTRGLWAMALDSAAASWESKVGIVIVLSPFFFITVIADVLLIVFVGLLALATGMLSWASCLALCFVPTREDLFQ